MKVMEDHLPQLNAGRFTCPHCNTFAQQRWTRRFGIYPKISKSLDNLYLDYRSHLLDSQRKTIESFFSWIKTTGQLSKFLTRDHINFFDSDFSFARCVCCEKFSLWLNSDMIYPASIPFPTPNEDLNDDIKVLYCEAAIIFSTSPRASAALLRLCVEKICRQLGETGDLNTSIRNLVRRGMSQRIQQALDYCRVIGNHAVHPGKIDLSENPERVKPLFNLINDIAQEMITKPKEMAKDYSFLPETSREQIDERDKNKDTRTDK